MFGSGSKLDERGRRLFAAAEVRAAGRGGLAVVSKIAALARSTINRGEDNLDSTWTRRLLPRSGRKGERGRHALGDKDLGLLEALRRLVDPVTFGDPTRRCRRVKVSSVMPNSTPSISAAAFHPGLFQRSGPKARTERLFSDLSPKWVDAARERSSWEALAQRSRHFLLRVRRGSKSLNHRRHQSAEDRESTSTDGNRTDNTVVSPIASQE
jgi:hypothetical protein